MRTRMLGRGLWADMVAAARQFVRSSVGYQWTAREYLALTPFFSNTGFKVFFIERMPEEARTSLLAMYSRLKNPRGIRGNWVDNLLPSMLAPFLPDCAALLDATKPEDRKSALERWMKQHRITSLDRFCDHSDKALEIFDWFLDASSGRTVWRQIADGERIKGFLQMWLDAYGHNSIARVGQVVLCCEDFSILVVKSLEWGRPGAGEIELSTRYVVVSSKGQYPFEREMELFDRTVARNAAELRESSMAAYRELMGDNLDGVFPQFLRSHWAGIVPDRDMATGVQGESCDVLGNLLPSSTLTSVGVAMSAEAFPQHIKHLILDGTAEGEALAEFITDEARRIGLGSFVRHERPTPWEIAHWNYLEAHEAVTQFMSPSDAYVKELLNRVYEEHRPQSSMKFTGLLDHMLTTVRGEYDKLPSQFESFTPNVWGFMSFRGWRDWQRMSFCSHMRGRITPMLGFYHYPKPAPIELIDAFKRIHSANEDLFMSLNSCGVPEELAEYPMALGNLVPYHSAANARQWEFCVWQRSDFSVNDEVRTEFLKVDSAMRSIYPWWERVSRADRTPHYVFARTAKGSEPVVLK